MANSISLGSREISVFKSKEEVKAKNVVYRIPCLRAGNVDRLLQLMRIYGVLDPNLNRTIYASTSTIWWNYLGLAINQDHYITDEEIKERNKLWGIKFDKAVRGQDFILDFDAKDIKKAFSDVLKVIDFFNEQELVYGVNFSGKKGFHIRIDSTIIKRSWNFAKKFPYKLQNTYLGIADSLKNMLDLKTLDTSTLGKRQPVRIPYSIHSSGLICLPLDQNQIDLLKNDLNKIYEMAEPENVLKLKLYDPKEYKDYNGYNRGMCYNKNPERTYKNMEKIFENLKSD